MRPARGLPKQMNHRIISVLIGVVIIAAVVGGVVYWEWPAMPPREERQSMPTSTTMHAPTSTIDLLKRATTSLLESLAKPAVGPPTAAAAPTISWMPVFVAQAIGPGMSK